MTTIKYQQEEIFHLKTAYLITFTLPKNVYTHILKTILKIQV